MSTGKGLRAVARWVMSEGLLLQFSLANEQIHRVEGRININDDGDGGRRGRDGRGLGKQFRLGRMYTVQGAVMAEALVRRGIRGSAF